MEVCLAFIASKGIDPINYIAKELAITKATVKTHLYDIYLKLLINSQVELMYLLMKELDKKPTD